MSTEGALPNHIRISINDMSIHRAEEEPSAISIPEAALVMDHRTAPLSINTKIFHRVTFHPPIENAVQKTPAISRPKMTDVSRNRFRKFPDAMDSYIVYTRRRTIGMDGVCKFLLTPTHPALIGESIAANYYRALSHYMGIGGIRRVGVKEEIDAEIARRRHSGGRRKSSHPT